MRRLASALACAAHPPAAAAGSAGPAGTGESAGVRRDVDTVPIVHTNPKPNSILLTHVCVRPAARARPAAPGRAGRRRCARWRSSWAWPGPRILNPCPWFPLRARPPPPLRGRERPARPRPSARARRPPPAARRGRRAARRRSRAGQGSGRRAAAGRAAAAAGAAAERRRRRRRAARAGRQPGRRAGAGAGRAARQPRAAPGGARTQRARWPGERRQRQAGQPGPRGAGQADRAAGEHGARAGRRNRRPVRPPRPTLAAVCGARLKTSGHATGVQALCRVASPGGVGVGAADCAVWCGGARAVRACLHRSLSCGRCQAVTAWAAPAGPGSARGMRSSRRRSRAGRPADRRRRPARELRRCRRAWQPCAAGAGGLAAALARLQAMGVANGRPRSQRMGGQTGAAWNRAEMRRTVDAGANTPGAFAIRGAPHVADATNHEC